MRVILGYLLLTMEAVSASAGLSARTSTPPDGAASRHFSEVEFSGSPLLISVAVLSLATTTANIGANWWPWLCFAARPLPPRMRRIVAFWVALAAVAVPARLSAFSVAAALAVGACL